MWWQKKRARRRSELAQTWGKRTERAIPIERASRLDRRAPPGEGSIHRIDDESWADLDLDRVFSAIDRTQSPAGAQLLYRTLREPQLEAERLTERDRLAEALTEDPETLLSIRCALDAEDPSWMVPDLLWRPLERLPLGARFFWAMRLLAAAALLVALTWWPPAALAVVAALGTNVVAGVWLEARLEILGEALAGVAETIAMSRRLSRALPDSLAERQGELEALARRTQRIERAVGLVGVTDPFELIPFVQRLLGSKPLAYAAAADLIEAEIETLRRLYLAIGEIDVALSIAWLRAERPLARPRFEGGELSIEAAAHPLIGGAVPNDAALGAGAGLLVTGSNMSGKTTYLKTIAVNAVLAQSIHAAFAASYRGPLLRVASSIDRLEDLEQRHSYFMAEALSIRRLIEVADAGPALLVIDELFRGTNPADRVAAGLAVLDYLGPRALVAIATHDGELCDSLAARFTELHFRDRIDGDEVVFDYRLRPGRSPRSNAIALLEHLGYPAAIVRSARRHRQRAGASGWSRLEHS